MRKGRIIMVIQVCIGSACHLKGSYEVISTMKKVIDERALQDQVELKSSFCLGNCSDAVSVKVNDDEVKSVVPEEAEHFLLEQLGLE
jgi:NADH:ubiquinone oxidoreductase subunit E